MYVHKASSFVSKYLNVLPVFSNKSKNLPALFIWIISADNKNRIKRESQK